MEKPPKAYKNIDFLQSREARTLRILAEYLEPEKRFVNQHIRHTVVFFGSARIDPERKDKNNMKKYYWAAEEFAYQLGCYSKELEEECQEGFAICSGGGPGIMEAANRGARRANAKSLGLNISLPFEQEPNNFITPELNFEFHYFFMRKLWFLYHAKAVVFFPGGFGTLDELFETLTLVQTGKLAKPNITILFYEKEFWENLINFNQLIKAKLISPHDVDLFRFFSSPGEGMELLKPILKDTIKKFCLK